MRRGIGLARTLLGASALGFSALGLSASASALPTNRVACQPSALRAAPPVASVLKLASTVQAPGRPTVVLVHGLDSTRFTWNAFIERQQQKYNIVALDLRGHGESSLGNVHDFTASTLASDIRHTLLHLNVPFPIALVGHSMGGRIAMQRDEVGLNLPLREAYGRGWWRKA